MTMKFETRKVSLGSIVVNESVNVRELDMKVVAQYQTDMEDVERGYGEDNWQARWNGSFRTVEVDGELHLYGGFHTHRAASAAFGNDHVVNVDVLDDDNVPPECRIPSLLAGGENGKHGRGRTNAEKREAVDRWLTCDATEDSHNWTDSYIAGMCDVSKGYVSKRDGKLREQLGEEYTRPDNRCYMRNGKVFWTDQTKRDATPAEADVPEAKDAPEADVPPVQDAPPETDEASEASEALDSDTPESNEASDSDTPETGEVEITDSLAESAGEADEEDGEDADEADELDEADADTDESEADEADEADEDDGEDADEADELEDSDEADDTDEDGESEADEADEADAPETGVEVDDTPQSPLVGKGSPNPQYRIKATDQTLAALSNAYKANGAQASFKPFASASLNDAREFGEMLDVLSPERIAEDFGAKMAKMYKPFYSMMSQMTEALDGVVREQIRQDAVAEDNNAE